MNNINDIEKKYKVDIEVDEINQIDNGYKDEVLAGITPKITYTGLYRDKDSLTGDWFEVSSRNSEKEAIEDIVRHLKYKR